MKKIISILLVVVVLFATVDLRKAQAAFQVYASDTFSYSALLDSHNLDNGLGGTNTVAWKNSFLQGAASNALIANGTIAYENSLDYDQVIINTTTTLVQRATVTCSSSGSDPFGMSYPFVMVRGSTGTGEGYGYRAGTNGGGGAGSTIQLTRMVNGTGTSLATGGVWNSGDTIAIEVTGNNQLVVYKNGSSIITYDDSANSSIPAGTGGFGNHGNFTNFKYEVDVTTTAPSTLRYRTFARLFITGGRFFFR